MDRDANGPEPTVDELPEPEELDEVQIELPTAEQEEQAERQLRLHALAKQRGQRREAREALEKAVETAPGALNVLIEQSKDLMDRSQSAKALPLLQRAVELYPQNIELERMYASAVLKVKAPDSELFAPTDFDVMARGKSAVWLSLMVPGLGQVVTGRKALGLGFFGVWVIGWLIALSIPGGMTGLLAMIGLSGSSVTDFKFEVLPPLFFAAAAHLSSISEAASASKKFEGIRVERPIPPVDKPF